MRLEPWRGRLNAVVEVPGDKSVTHRGILFAALAEGITRLEGWLDAGDTRSSLALVEALGVRPVAVGPQVLELEGPGRRGLHQPDNVVDCGNSGTTMRIGAGLAAGIPGLTVLTGDASLRRRPMDRVLHALAELGVHGHARAGGRAPLVIVGGRVGGGTVRLAVASAQVKSAVLLAGMFAAEPVTVVEPLPTRDHTERLLAMMGAAVRSEGRTVTVAAPARFKPLQLTVPGDPSSAAFWLTLAAVGPVGSRVTVPRLSLNPGRVGLLEVLRRMGAEVRVVSHGAQGEPLGDVTVVARPLRGVRVEAAEIPSLVDEVPLVALLGARAQGRTRVEGAGELRVKESDRIRATVAILGALGVPVRETADGFEVDGPAAVHGGRVEGYGDHRMVMLAAVAASCADGPVEIAGEEAVAISYPQFFSTYRRLQHEAASA